MLGQCCAGWVQATKPLCYGSVKISFCLKIPSFVATDRDRISYEFSLKISTDVMPTNTEETVFNCLLTSPHIPPWKSAHIHVRWMLYNTYCGNVSVVCSDFTCQRLILAAELCTDEDVFTVFTRGNISVRRWPTGSESVFLLLEQSHKVLCLKAALIDIYITDLMTTCNVSGVSLYTSCKQVNI